MSEAMTEDRLKELHRKWDCPWPTGLDKFMFRQCLDEIDRLRKENEQLRAALKEITEGKGAYSVDPFTHATNCLEDMKAIAISALE